MRKEASVKIVKIRGDLHPIGVYSITIIATGDMYIGSSWYSIRRRVDMHRSLLSRGKHNNKELQRLYNEFGIDGLKYDTIEICDKDKCIEREQFYLDTLNSTLNIQRVAGLPIGNQNRLGKGHTPEQCAKWSAERKGKPNNKLKGHIVTEETRNKIRNALNIYHSTKER